MKVNIPNFNEARVMVIGDIMVNRFRSAEITNASVKDPTATVQVTTKYELPGGAANVALNIASLGGQVSLFGITGDDDIAQSLDDKLSTLDIICHFYRKQSISTLTNSQIINHRKLIANLDIEDLVTELDKSDMLTIIADNIPQHHIILLADYDKGTLSDAQSIITLARKNDIPVVVYSQGTEISKYHGASLIILNIEQLHSLVASVNDEIELVDKSRKLLAEHKINALLLTRSEYGVTLIRSNADVFHIPSQAQEVYDENGADDTLVATVALSIAAGSSIAQASALANIAAGIVFTKLGSASVSEVEIIQALASGQADGAGVVSEQQLKMIIEQAKLRGEKITLTSGCFDILDAGHLSYFAEAAQLGDRLVVAVKDDDSVKRLKGSGRPINPLNRRMALLAGIDSVDWVVKFSEDTPHRLIANLLPDLLVKGNDIEVKDIAGAKEVIANGGEVQILNFAEDIPTSEIINTIRLED